MGAPFELSDARPGAASTLHTRMVFPTIHILYMFSFESSNREQERCAIESPCQQ